VTRAILIANPNAARTDAATVEALARTIRGAGWDLEVLATTAPGHARELAAYGVREGVDVVAVFGGDGTTMQAAAALVGTDTALGLLPGGTGNLLAGNLRLPTNPLKAAEAMVRGQPMPLDLGRMPRPDGEHYFAVACGAGIDARVMVETDSAQKRKWGMMAYVATTLRLLPELTNIPFRITVDGVTHEAEGAMLLVANCGEVIPPLVKLGQGISPTDGMLDVMVLRANSFTTSVRAVWDLLTDAGGALGKDVTIGYARGREVGVEILDGRTHQVQMDGDPGGVTPFTTTVVPGAIRVLRPVA
jgi:YegS/Rv2252/BmrU family lipid kinase